MEEKVKLIRKRLEEANDRQKSYADVKLLEVVNPVAYRIALPPALAWLHDVFDVSYLKKYVSDFAHMIDWNSLQVQDPGVVMIEPISVLEVRKQRLRNTKVTQCNVQWDQYTKDNATWEDYNEIHQRFPHLFNVFNS
ncbi:uncharacterized protein LOC131875736 [Cryptomeria japonica]|uniref:uncharacterized protein LOC131875736 n=1 Tax=Cryptomeria japonica TaxID=3369 RepID=UPI0027DA1203|nr:uncharacterized protein LOC131875736 [Cryptomeria japonica]